MQGTPQSILLQSRAVKEHVEERLTRLRLEASWVAKHFGIKMREMRAWLNGEESELTEKDVVDILTLLCCKVSVAISDTALEKLTNEQKEQLALVRNKYESTTSDLQE
jgi:hypothetical protein